MHIDPKREWQHVSQQLFTTQMFNIRLNNVMVTF